MLLVLIYYLLKSTFPMWTSLSISESIVRSRPGFPLCFHLVLTLSSLATLYQYLP